MSDKFRLDEIVEFGGFVELTKELQVYVEVDELGAELSAVVKKPLKKGTLVKVHQLIAKDTVAMLEELNTQNRCLVKSIELIDAIK